MKVQRWLGGGWEDDKRTLGGETQPGQTTNQLEFSFGEMKFYCLRQGTSKRGEEQPFLSC